MSLTLEGIERTFDYVLSLESLTKKRNALHPDESACSLIDTNLKKAQEGDTV